MEIKEIKPLVHGLTFHRDGLVCAQVSRAYGTTAFRAENFHVLMALYHLKMHYQISIADITPSDIPDVDNLEKDILENTMHLQVLSRNYNAALFNGIPDLLKNGTPVLVKTKKNFLVEGLVGQGVDTALIKGFHKESGNFVLLGNAQILPLTFALDCFAIKEQRRETAAASKPGLSTTKYLHVDLEKPSKGAILELVGDIYCNYYEHAESLSYYAQEYSKKYPDAPSQIQVIKPNRLGEQKTVAEIVREIKTHLMAALDNIDTVIENKIAFMIQQGKYRLQQFHQGNASLALSQSMPFFINFLNSQSVFYVSLLNLLDSRAVGLEQIQDFHERARDLANGWKDILADFISDDGRLVEPAEMAFGPIVEDLKDLEIGLIKDTLKLVADGY